MASSHLAGTTCQTSYTRTIRNQSLARGPFLLECIVSHRPASFFRCPKATERRVCIQRRSYMRYHVYVHRVESHSVAAARPGNFPFLPFRRLPRQSCPFSEYKSWPGSIVNRYEATAIQLSREKWRAGRSEESCGEVADKKVRAETIMRAAGSFDPRPRYTAKRCSSRPGYEETVRCDKRGEKGVINRGGGIHSVGFRGNFSSLFFYSFEK